MLMSVSFALLLVAAPVGGAAVENGQAPPDWVAQSMAARVGVWIADNSLHRSEAEPWEAYGIEWTWGLGQRSLIGRLYGIRDGKDVATFWQFREYWHPGEKQLVALQFGADGTVGIGPHIRKADGSDEILQVFYAPDGSASRIGHRSTLRGDEQVSQSFDVSEDGTWAPRRSYVWRKQAQ